MQWNKWQNVALIILAVATLTVVVIALQLPSGPIQWTGEQ